MKNFLFSFVFVCTFSFVNAQTFTDAVAYNDYIVEQQNLVGADILILIDKFNEVDMTKEAILPTLEKLLGTAKSALTSVKKITPYEGDTQLKLAAVNLFQFYVRIIDNDYRTMIELLYGGEMTDDISSRLNTIVQKVQEDEAVIDENFATAQAAFAEKYNIELQTNELQGDFDKD